MGSPFRVWLLIGLLLIAGLVGWLLFDAFGEGPESAAVRSLAVLPFTSASDKQEDLHLAAGLNLDLRSRLGRVTALQSSAAGPSTAHRSAGLPERERASRLGAEILVRGVAGQESGRIRLSLEIQDAVAGTTLAQIDLEESREHIFDLQRRAALEIVRSLDLSLSSREESVLRQNPTRSLKAWDYAVQGQIYLEDPLNPRGPVFAADLYRRAIQLDLDFAQARVGLSDALWLGHLRVGKPETLKEAEVEARRVLLRDPHFAPAAVVLTKILHSRQSGASRPSFSDGGIARLRKPDEALREVAEGLLQVGKLELSEAAWQAAIDSRPLYWLNWFGLGQFFMRGGRYAEAESVFLRANDLAPDTVQWPRESLAKVKLATGDLAGAVESFETLRLIWMDGKLIRQIAAAYVDLRRLQDADYWYGQVALLAPDDPLLHQEIGDLRTRMNRAELAEESYRLGVQTVERLLADSPEKIELQIRLIVLSAKLADCSRSLSLAGTLHRHGAIESPEIYQDLAMAYVLCGEDRLALETLGTALVQGAAPEAIRTRPEFSAMIDAGDLDALLEELERIPPSP